MKTRFYFAALLTLISGIAVSCSDDSGITPPPPTPAAPVISFDNKTDVYTVKAGNAITITPHIENDIESAYLWITGKGDILSTDKALVKTFGEPQQLYVTFEVKTPYGEDSKEIRIDVMKLTPPTIALTVPEGGFEVLFGKALELKPVVANESGSEFLWTLDGEEVSTEKDYTFNATKLGEFEMAFATHNEDGEDSITFTITVKNPEDMQFAWVFDKTEYYVSKGRSIRLMPYDIQYAFDARYEWSIDSEVRQDGESEKFVFDAIEEGKYTVRVTMANAYGMVWQDLTVTVCPPEGTYIRNATASSSLFQNKVFEYLPAPGQFINEDHTLTTMTEATEYALRQLDGTKTTLISLGAWGGYVIAGFDHSVLNDGDYNIEIKGNAFENSSEPAIVWVMQDENGDKQPNDTWYELKGSEYGQDGYIRDYAVTYYYPSAANGDVVWIDNLGNTGSVDVNPFHTQDYYYPLWADRPSYTLRGSYMKFRTVQISVVPEFWENQSYEWGYADNFSAIDRVANNANHFRISDAVRFDGEPAGLQYIDFVMVQTAVQAKAGWLGEVSPEIVYIKDYNLSK